VYHALFLRLFKAMVKCHHITSMKALLSKYKFLTRMIKHFTTSTTFDTGLRGYILLMGNYLRLTADMLSPSDYLTTFLSSHGQWRDFVPLLTDETIRQMVTDYSASSGHGAAAHLNPFSMHDFGLYSSATKCKPVTPDDVDIDLGSEYANNLGFEDAVAFTAPSQSRKKRKRRRRRSQGGAGGSLGSSSSGEEEESEPESESEKREGTDDGVDDGEGEARRGNENGRSDGKEQEKEKEKEKEKASETDVKENETLKEKEKEKGKGRGRGKGTRNG